MILVPSRHQPLNGSSLLLLLIVLVLAGCGGQRSLTDSNNNADKDLPRVYNPSTGKYEPVTDPMAMVDTVVWQTVGDVPPPIGAEPEAPSGKKDVYDVSLLIPFNSDKATFGNRIDPKSRRFLHYYSGLKLGLEDLETKGIRINAKVHDTKESIENVEALLDEARTSDVIIGPYNRDCLDVAADFAARRKIPVISPWTPAISPEAESDYFVQTNPGLVTHAEAAMRFAARNFGGSRFILVASPQTSSHSRMDIFMEAFEKYNKGVEMEKLVVDDIALRPDSNDLTEIYIPDTTHVFVMPFYQRSEEEFVNSFIRKIHADHGEVPVVVIGMPQWLGFNSLNADYMEGLNTHISAVQFVDNSAPEVKAFNERFLEVYGTIPETSAWRAYELISYVGSVLDEYGTGFIGYMPDSQNTSFMLEPVFADGSDAETRKRPLYLENKGIQILQFRNQQFLRIE